MALLHLVLCSIILIWGASAVSVLLVPGIGGSMLLSEDTMATSSNNRYQHIWPVMINQDNLLRRALNKQVFSNGTFDSGRYNIYVPLANYGLSAMYDLNPDLLIFKTETYYMKTLIDMLLGQNFTMGVDLFGFPYDWRYPVNYKPHLNSLELLFNSKPNEEWVVIAHSMGGLVMQEYFKSGVNSGRNDSRITLITVGTPFHGVGGRSLEAFTRGYNFGNPKLSLNVAKEFVIETFSAYDLLPQPQLQPIPTINFEDYMKHIAVGDFHADRIRTRECFTRPRSYYIYTSGVPTPHDISITKSNIDGEIGNTFLDGDGTVPSVSATNSGCHNEHPINLMITADHMEMLNNLRFLGIVLWIVKLPCPDISGYYRCSDDTIVHVDHTVPSFDMTHGWYAIGKIGDKEARYYTPREYCGQYIFKNTEIHCLKRGSAPLTGLSPSLKNWTETIECPKDYVLVDGLCLRNITTVVYQCSEGSKLVEGKCTAITVVEEKEVRLQTLTVGLAVLSVVGIAAAVALAVLHFKKRKPVGNFQPLTTELEEVSIERVT